LLLVELLSLGKDISIGGVVGLVVGGDIVFSVRLWPGTSVGDIITAEFRLVRMLRGRTSRIHTGSGGRFHY
jgi:hypothetical protein